MSITQQRKNVSIQELINPHPKQCEYLRVSFTPQYKYILFGGARSGGKSYIERWRHVLFLLDLSQKGFRNKKSAIFSQTYSEIRERQFIPAKNEFPKWLGKFNETQLEFRLNPEYGGHTICFNNMDKLESYQSQEFCTIGIEEVTLLPSWDIIAFLSGSLRCPGLEHTPLCCTCNPGGIGTSWVKGLWVTKDLFHQPDYSRLKPEQFRFVQSLPTDNPHTTENYIETLKSLPEYKRKLWLEGNWDVKEGNRFNFNPLAHVIEPIPKEELEKLKVYYYGAMDYGFNNPMAFGIYAITSSDEKPDIYKIKEINISDLEVESQADLILKTLKDMGIALKSPIYLDPACWQERGTGLSIANTLTKKGLSVQKAKNDRPAGWVALEDLLAFKMDYGTGQIIKQPRLKIFSTCIKTIQQLTDAMWDPKKEGDIMHPDSFRDDSLDETRYFALSHTSKPKEPYASSQDEMLKKLWKQGQQNTNRIKIR